MEYFQENIIAMNNFPFSPNYQYRAENGVNVKGGGKFETR